MDGTEYGHDIDELLERHCGGYDSADYVRLAMAAATEALLLYRAIDEGQLLNLQGWLLASVAHTAQLPRTVVVAALAAHEGRRWKRCYGDDVDAALAGLPMGKHRPELVLRLCLAALDQAGMSARGQEHVEALLWGEPA